MKTLNGISPLFFTICSFWAASALAGRWVSGDTHNHTATSYDCTGGTAYSSMKDAIFGAGYNFIIITDHDEWGEWTNGNVAKANDLYADKDHLVLMGNEVSINQHWTIAGLKYQDRSAAVTKTSSSYKMARWIEFLTNLKQVGAWANINHPERGKESSALSSASELRDIIKAGMGGFEIFNQGSGWEVSANLRSTGGWWDQVLSEGYHLAPIAATDNHGGGHYGGFARTNVYVEGDSLTEKAILDGLKAGHVWAVGQKYSSSAAIRTKYFTMEFTVNGKMVGDVVAVGDYAQATIKADLDPRAWDAIPKLSVIKVIVDGVAVYDIDPNAPTFETTISIATKGKKYARLEVWADNTVSSKSILKAFSSPVYFGGTTTATQEGLSKWANPMLNWQVSPNPAHTMTRVTFNEALLRTGQPVTELKVFNVSGKMVIRFNPNRKNLASGVMLNLSDLPAGNFLLKAKVGQNVLTRRLSVQK